VDSVRRKKAEKVVSASSPAAEEGAPAASSALVDDSAAASPRERESNVAASGSKSVAAKALAAVAKQCVFLIRCRSTCIPYLALISRRSHAGSLLQLPVASLSKMQLPQHRQAPRLT
jgi:hypothetical protein